MIGDPWPEEPDDPFEDYHDPEERATRDVPSPGEVDVSKGLFRAFWGLVAVFNVGLFATSLGLLLVAFRGQWVVGGVVALIGVASLVYGVHRYRVYRTRGFDPE